MEKVIILIPAYEPDDKLIELLKTIKNKTNNIDIIVVNDGSNSNYDEIFSLSKKYSNVLSYKENKGKGYALKYGLSYIKRHYEDNYYIVTMDCDGQHKIDDAIKLAKYLKLNKDTLVLGKRLRSYKTPFRSRLGNSITKTIFYVTTGLDIYDTQTGLRAFSSKLIDYMLKVEGERYEYEMNVLLNLKKNNIKVKELEIETIYIDNNSGSHFNTIKDSFKIYKEIIKFSISSILSFIIDYLLYIIFFLLSSNIIISNIISRFISASINYNINKKIVFKNNNSNSLLKYIFLATIILLLNTIFLNILTMFLDVFVAKLVTELVLFILSFSIQKVFIFKGGKV